MASPVRFVDKCVQVDMVYGDEHDPVASTSWVAKINAKPSSQLPPALSCEESQQPAIVPLHINLAMLIEKLAHLEKPLHCVIRKLDWILAKYGEAFANLSFLHDAMLMQGNAAKPFTLTYLNSIRIALFTCDLVCHNVDVRALGKSMKYLNTKFVEYVKTVDSYLPDSAPNDFFAIKLLVITKTIMHSLDRELRQIRVRLEDALNALNLIGVLQCDMLAVVDILIKSKLDDSPEGFPNRMNNVNFGNDWFDDEYRCFLAMIELVSDRTEIC